MIRAHLGVGCGSDVLVLGLLPVKGYLHEKGRGGEGGGGGGGGGQKQQERERLQLHYSLPAFTVLYNSRGKKRRRRGAGMTGGSVGWGEECSFLT